MKKASKFVTAAVLLLATIGAFAASKKQTLSPVFVQTSATVCELKWAEPCTFIGSPLCSIQTYNSDNTSDPHAIVQVYSDISANEQTCLDAYRSQP